MITPPDLFNLLSDETRLRCILLLLKEKEVCVCDLSSILESTQPKISRHLAVLRQSGLVLDERRGQWVYYSLHPDIPQWAHALLTSTFKNLKDSKPFSKDIKTLSEKQRSC